TMKNRLVKAPQSSWLWNEDGTMGDSMAQDMYESMAKGGIGAVTVAAMLWEPLNFGIYAFATDDKFIPGMRRFNEVIHQYGTVTIGQLHHMGPSAWDTYDGLLPPGPSEMAEEDIPTPPPFGRAVRALTVDQIREKQELFVQAAVRWWKGGIDCVEIHAANGYFLNSFLSPSWNHRDDEYGWEDVQNRTRIHREIIQAIRERTDDDFVIGIRINGQEWSDRYIGIQPSDAAQTAKALQDAGAQYISVCGYGYGTLSFRYDPDYFAYPDPEPFMEPFKAQAQGEGLFVPGAAAITKAVDIPTWVSGLRNEDWALRVVQEGKATGIAFGRQMWADPEYPNKLKEGRFDDILRCTHCASCEDPVTQPRYCRVNPGLGKRDMWPEEHPAKKKKKVMVVGGGPAGMECAITAAKRGHDVTIYEKSGELGGKTKLASMIKGNTIEDVMPIYDYLTTQIAKAGVKVRLHTEVGPNLIKQTAPDVLVSAISAPYYVPDIPGINQFHVWTIPQMTKLSKIPMKLFGPRGLEKIAHTFFPVGKRIAVIGAGAEGAQCAEFMHKIGKDVVLVAEDEDIGGLITARYKERLEWWFDYVGIEVIKNARCTAIGKKDVTLSLADKTTRTVSCDCVMIMLPEVRDDTFYNTVKGLAPEVYEVGSTLGGDNVFFKHAFKDGRSIGVQI
ncbi:MAG: FAD-dependent oxidoreductase, partial [Eggerthellaceae bacterium]|nr:FAD-dependent oxidoreductase [Eggerthellaceae bacterium]